MAACSPAREELARYDGGSVGGPLERSSDHFIGVAVERMDSPMAERTTIRLGDGVPVSMTHVTPEFLLARGRVFVPRDPPPAKGSDESRFEQLQGLRAFDPAKTYVVIIGPVPQGPFYRFDVKEGRAHRFGTAWPGGFLDDGETLRPAPVFIDSKGIAHEMPFSIEVVKQIWGEPRSIDRR